MRSALLTIILALVASSGSGANIRFVSPLEGGQAIGPQWIEIATDATTVDRVEFSVDGVLVGVARKPPFRIAYDFGTALEGHEIAARVISDGFKKTETATIRSMSISAGESINVDLVEVPLRVRVPDNRIVTAADLRVRENSVDQTIREIKPGRGAAEFVFIVDRSLSMRNGRLEAALAAVDVAARMLRADDRASLILFNHNVSRPRPLTAREISNASGGTALRDALAAAASPGRTYAIVITDGGDRNSVLSDEEALRRISSAKTMVSAVVLGQASRFLQQATANTGGTLRSASAGTISAEVKRIMADINSRYTLVYQSQGTRNGWRTIAIETGRGIDLVSARRGYFAR